MPTKVLPRRNYEAKTPLNQSECDSAIGLHILQNPDCAAQYHVRQFSILAKARTQLHLAALKAISYQSTATKFVPAERICQLSSNFTIFNH